MVSLGSFSVVSLLRLFRLFGVGHLEMGVEAVGMGRAVGFGRNVDRTGVFLFYLIEVQTDSGLFLRSDYSTISKSVWLRWVEFV